MNKQGWIYPDAANVAAQFKSFVFHTLKPEYATVLNTGKIGRITFGQNSYTPQNAQLVKDFSDEQYFTVSASHATMSPLCSTIAKRTAGVTFLMRLVRETKFTGIDIDFEGFGQWTLTQYSNYKKFLIQLGDALHAEGFKLMVCLPPIGSVREQGYYKLKYEEMAKLPIDYFTIMAYDYQFDYGAGSPVAPIAWVKAICLWAKSKLPLEKIVIGVPNYGYHAPYTYVNGLKVPTYEIKIDTKRQSRAYPGFATAQRNPDGEMGWENNNMYYCYQDAIGLKNKLDSIQAQGIKAVSYWHLGDNDVV